MTAHRQAFQRWAPTNSAWSDWAKPALFATAPPDAGLGAPQTPFDSGELAHVPYPGERVAMVLDLPGPYGVRAGLALAHHGYRPVPLYNTTHGDKAAVDVLPIAHALIASSEQLEQIRIEPGAPPAFLLDSNRLPTGAPPAQGVFDNRWMVFPQDFPSAILLKSHGIERALLVQQGLAVRDDLAHVLLRWQEAGIAMQLTSPGLGENLRPLVVTKPPLYRRAWYRLLSIMRLRRNNVGGFGAVVPIAAAG